MARLKKTENDARERLIEAAGRGFKKGGFGGIGVDALAREAGLTSGAFYSHLGSKAGAFRLAVEDGLAFLQSGISDYQNRFGAEWRDRFVDFYLGERMSVGLDEACTLPSLSADVSRADGDTRKLYETALQNMAETIAAGPGRKIDVSAAWAYLSILTGAAGLARAVDDPRLRNDILASAARAAKAL